MEQIFYTFLNNFPVQKQWARSSLGRASMSRRAQFSILRASLVDTRCQLPTCFGTEETRVSILKDVSGAASTLWVTRWVQLWVGVKKIIIKCLFVIKYCMTVSKFPKTILVLQFIDKGLIVIYNCFGQSIMILLFDPNFFL